MKQILDFDDAGASDDEPARGVTVGDIRAWHDQYDKILTGADPLAVAQAMYDWQYGKGAWMAPDQQNSVRDHFVGLARAALSAIKGPRMVTDHDMRMEALRLFEENERLVKAIKASCGYLMNAKIDLSTNCTKATAIRTIEDGIKLAQGTLASVGDASKP